MKNKADFFKGNKVLLDTLAIIWRSSKKWTIIRVILSVIHGVLPLGTLYLIKKIVDQIVLMSADTQGEGIDYNSFILFIVLWLGLILTTTLLGLLLNYISELHNHQMSIELQGMIQEKALAVEYMFYDTDNYHDIFHRAQREANTRPQKLLNDLSSLISSGASVAILSTIFLTLHWFIGFAFILVALPTVLVQSRYIRKFHFWKLQTTQLERRANYINQIITFKDYAKENRIYKIGTELRALFLNAKRELLRGNLKILNTFLKSNISISLIEVIFLGSIFSYVIIQTGNGVISIGSMVMYFQAFQRGQKAMKDFMMNLNKLFEQKLFLSHLFEFLNLDIASQTDEMSEMNQVKPISKIEVRNLSFSYLHDGSRKTLDKIDLTLQKGEILAVVGENGSGKSTLIKLLCGFHHADEGEILIDGEPIQNVDLDSYWSEVSVLFQDFSQFNLSAGFNVCARESDWNEESLTKSTDYAGATGIIQSLPNGFKTKLGRQFKGGWELSLGQYQRLALSRAIHKPASLLIMDEPTSFIDGNSEQLFLNHLREIAKEKIVVLISHKLSNVILADKICVLDKGQKVEYGTHEELAANGSMYRKMFRAQMIHSRNS